MSVAVNLVANQFVPSNAGMSRTQPSSYALPADDIPSHVRESLHPWIEGFLGLPPTSATKRLHDRWASIFRDSMVSLRDVLSSFEVREIVDFQVGGMVKAVRQHADDESIGNCFYLPAPLESDVLESRLESVSLLGNEAVHEFMVHFGGLAEDTTVSGHFVYCESPWPTFTESSDDYTPEDFEEWRDSLMLFCARNGCYVLVHPSGRVAWWVIQEHSIRELTANFDEFLLQFAEHRKLAWPFDPYGPP